jgi:hypothetical protein
MSVSARAVLVAAAVAAVGFVPWSANPFYRLAGREGDGPDPRFDAPLDARELESAATSLPADLTYATSAPAESPLVQGNLKAAGQLYLWRQLPVQDPRRAELVFTYRNGVVVSQPAR